MVIVKVLRWVMGSGIALMGGLSIASFVVFITTDIQLWLQRSRMLRQWTFVLVLLWFNAEIWGSVVHTLLTW